jgi:hypothetical protein
MATSVDVAREVRIPVVRVSLVGVLCLPPLAEGVILFGVG